MAHQQQNQTDWFRYIAESIQAFFTNIVTSVLNIGSGSIRTTNYQISEESINGEVGVSIVPTSTNSPGIVHVRPTGTSELAYMNFFGNNAADDDYLNIGMDKDTAGFIYTVTFGTPDVPLIIGTQGAAITEWTFSPTGSITLPDPGNLVLGTSTGTKIGTAASQKIGFWNASPIVQPSTTGTTTGFTAGMGTAVNDDSTFTGNTGTKAYTIGDIVKALKDAGLMAAS